MNYTATTVYQSQCYDVMCVCTMYVCLYALYLNLDT